MVNLQSNCQLVETWIWSDLKSFHLRLFCRNIFLNWMIWTYTTRTSSFSHTGHWMTSSEATPNHHSYGKIQGMDNFPSTHHAGGPWWFPSSCSVLGGVHCDDSMFRWEGFVGWFWDDGILVLFPPSENGDSEDETTGEWMMTRPPET